MHEQLSEQRIQTIARSMVGGEKRIDILDAAIEVIVRRGFDSTRYVDIAEASGVAVSTLQYYFGSLESLLIETCLYASQRDYEKVEQRLNEHRDAWTRLVYLVDVFMTSESPGPGWQAQIEYWRASFTRPHLRDELIRDQDRWRAMIAGTIRLGKADGTFVTDRDPELIAMQITCQLDGTVFPGFVGNPSFDAQAFRTAVVDDLARLLGYANDKST